jgi:hypothetical protein
MRALSTSELLRAWEQGHGEPSYRRALLLLTAACPEQSPGELAKLSIGSRDARLMTLREWTFGPKLTCITTCPDCGERLEINASVADIRIGAPEPEENRFHLASGDYQIDFRLPCTIDLKEASGYLDSESVRMAIIRRCILKARRSDEEVAVDQLPAPVIKVAVAHMAEHDPQADTRLALTCPGCGHRWNALFDIVSFFWTEIQSWAMRILREVHILASVYGWQEADILTMSPLRRRSYLSMVGV